MFKRPSKVEIVIYNFWKMKVAKLLSKSVGEGRKELATTQEVNTKREVYKWL